MTATGLLQLRLLLTQHRFIVPRTLARLRVNERNISVTWQIKSSKWVIDFARAGVLKTGFANVLHIPSDMNVLYESRTPHMCWVPEDHALAAQTGPITLRSLRPYRLIGLLGQVSDELSVRHTGANADSPLVVETSLAALTLADACGGVALVDAFTAQYWSSKHAGIARAISDIPAYRFAVFEPFGVRPSIIDKEFREILVSEIDSTKDWVQRQTST